MFWITLLLPPFALCSSFLSFCRFFHCVAHAPSDSDDGDSDTKSLLSNNAKSLDDPEEGTGPVDMITKLQSRKRHNFTTSWGPVGFNKSQHPLSIMVSIA